MLGVVFSLIVPFYSPYAATGNAPSVMRVRYEITPRQRA